MATKTRSRSTTRKPARRSSQAKSGEAKQDPKARYDQWPKEGGLGANTPQPWDLQGQGVEQDARELEPGEPDTVSPVVVEHTCPILTSGSSDPSVQDLGRALAAVGYPNSVSRGENPFGFVDDSIMGAVHRFRDAYDVQEDPSAFGGHTPAGRTNAAAHVGPWTWEAVRRAAERAKA